MHALGPRGFPSSYAYSRLPPLPAEEQKVEAMSTCLSEPNPVRGEKPKQQQSNLDSDDKMEEEDGGSHREGDAGDNDLWP